MEVEEDGEHHVVGVREPEVGYHEREHGCDEAVDRKPDKDLFLVELLYKKRAGRHAYHRADGG